MAANKENQGGFEQSDVNVIAVGKFGIMLLLCTIVAMALVVGLFKVLQSMEGGKAASMDPTHAFPLPQVQKTPVLDLEKYRAGETQALNSYGWVDQQKGVVRIPIDKAMDMVVQKGLPVRTAAPPVADQISQPTESSLGAKMQPPGGPLGEGK